MLLQGGAPILHYTCYTHGFTRGEDILLVNAWINTGIDPIQENDQKASKFWD
jgi:hypothetical protein